MGAQVIEGPAANVIIGGMSNNPYRTSELVEPRMSEEEILRIVTTQRYCTGQDGALKIEWIKGGHGLDIRFQRGGSLDWMTVRVEVGCGPNGLRDLIRVLELAERQLTERQS